MKKLIAITLTSAALIVSMSAPARAEHGETIVGAVIGTTVGTVIGHQIGGRRGSLIGAVIGAATGATIGQDVGYRHHEWVEYYPEPVYRPRPVERVVYVPVEEPRVDYAPPPYDYDDCDDLDEHDHGRWKRGHGRKHGWDHYERGHRD